MSERDLEALERRLRTLPPLLDVPASLVAPSVQAGVREPDLPTRTLPARRRSRAWSRRWSFAGVAAVAAAVVAVAVTVTSLGGHAQFQRIATLSGAGKASGDVAVGPARGAIEPVVVTINHLAPAPPDQYYEIWFTTGGQQVPGVAFNADANGTAEIHLSAPTDTQWVRCWITRQSLTHPNRQTIVMRANRQLT